VREHAIRNFFGTPEFRNIGAIYVEGSDRKRKAGGPRIYNYLVNIMKEDSNIRPAISAVRLAILQLFTWLNSVFDSDISPFCHVHQTAPLARV
jgi:hypothetical protein